MHDACGTPLEVLDLKARRREFAFPPPSALRPGLRSLLRNERDEPLLWALLNLCLVPLACASLFCFAPHSHLVGGFYLAALYATSAQRCFLTLHYASHRPVFRHRALNAMFPELLSPFFGLLLGIYRLHHVVMHHVESNGGADWTSTAGFSRDSPSHAALYVLKFTFGAVFGLPSYAWRHRRRRDALRAVAGMLFHGVLIFLARRVAPVAALYACVLPTLISLPILAFGAFCFSLVALHQMIPYLTGNWSQHVFVNPTSSGGASSPFAHAYTCINHPDNQFTFNDGFHVEHHVNGGTHWSELPSAFQRSLPSHAAADALVFSGVHFFDVGFAALCGTRGLRRLAKRYAQVGQPPRTQAELVDELRRRLQPVHLKRL